MMLPTRRVQSFLNGGRTWNWIGSRVRAASYPYIGQGIVSRLRFGRFFVAGLVGTNSTVEEPFFSRVRVWSR